MAILKQIEVFYKMKIKLCDGEYEYVYNEGKQLIFRNGEMWRNVTGDKLILSMARMIESLEEELSIAIDIIEDSGVSYSEIIKEYVD